MSHEPRPSATVVAIRDAGDGIEVLLLERAAREEGASGLHVFPGGKIEAVDRSGPGDLEQWARRAAVREAREEAGLRLADQALVPISRWITPEVAPKRFDTWFFAASVDAGQEVRVDGGEIHQHRWLPPRTALAAHHRREIRLAPPTFVTVSWLTAWAAVSDALDALRESAVLTFRPRICRVEGGMCMLYPGDAGYEAGEVDRPGSRHRLWTLPDGWRYERS